MQISNSSEDFYEKVNLLQKIFRGFTLIDILVLNINTAITQ